MAEQYTAGQLLVPVKPDARGARQKVQREFDNMADPTVRIDADIRDLEKKLATETAKLDQLEARKVDPKIDLDIAEMTAKLAQANARLDELRNKPTSPKVDADIALAEVKVARVTRSLQVLEETKASPKIDLDIANADARIAGMRAQLDQLRAQRVEVKVDADTTTATGRLAEFGRQAQLIRDVRTTLDLDVGGALMRIAMVNGALLAVPAIAGGAAYAVGGIGLALAPAVGAALLLPAAIGGVAIAQGALQIATMGVGDTMALAFDPTKVAKFQQELAKLSPEARATVLAVAGLQPALSAVRMAAQDALFAGVAPLIGQLAGPYLPMAEATFARIAGAVNLAGLSFGTWLTSAYAVGYVRQLADGTAVAFGNVMAAVAPLAASFIMVGAIGAPILAQLTAGAAGVAGRLASWVGSAQGIQTITAWIWNGILVLQQLGALLGNVAMIFGSFMSAANTAGASVLDTLVRLTGQVALFLNSMAGQQMLVALFTNIRLAVDAAMPGIQALLGGVGYLITGLAPLLPQVGGAFTSVVLAASPLFRILVDLLTIVLPPLLGLIQQYPGVFIALAGIVYGVSLAFTALRVATQLFAVVQAAQAIPALWGAVTATWAWTAALLANPITWVVLLIAALVAAVIYCYFQFDTFRAIVDGAWRGIVAVAMWAWSNILQPIFGFLVAAVQLAGTVIMWLWTNVFVPAWQGIAAAVSFAWNNIILPVLTAIDFVGRLIAGVILTVLLVAFQVAWALISTAVSVAWNNIILPIWNALVAFVNSVLIPLMQFLYNNVVKPIWDAIGAIISFIWQNVILPTWNALVGFVNGVLIPLVIFLYNNVFKPMWDAIGVIISFTWQNVILPIWNALVSFVNGVLIPLMQFLYNNVIKPVWDAIGAVIMFVWTNVIRPAWDAVAAGLRTLGDIFQQGTDRIGTIWNTIRGMLARPINFMIDVVWNKGIVPAWNKVAQLVGLGPIQPLGLIPEFASGGVYAPNRYTPGRDIGYAALSGGEAVMRPEWTRVMGTDYVAQANAAARAGGQAGVSSFLSSTGSTSPAAEGRAKLGLMRRYPIDGAPPGQYLGAFAPGGVAPHVARAADEAERLFGRMPGGIGGLGARANASDHPKGLALDLMTLSNVDLGTRVADFFLQNAGRLGVKYIIYRQRINQGKGWVGMPDRGSVTANHMDHPHVSFNPGPGGGGAFAGGGIGGAISSFISTVFMDAARGAFDTLTNPAIELVRKTVGPPPPDWRQVPPALATKMRDSVRDFVFRKAGEKDAAASTMGGPLGSSDSSIGAPGAGGGGAVERWRPLVIAALNRQRLPADPGTVNRVLMQLRSESGGNPNAVNNWDINAKRGTPSGGLLQTIAPTFARYRDPGLANNMFDPFANINASLRYAMARYGSLTRAYRGVGYDRGGVARGTGIMLKDTIRDERVLDPVETRQYDTLGPLVQELQRARVPGSVTTAREAQAAAAGAASVATMPSSFHLTSGRLRFDADGLLQIVDGRLDAVTDKLTDRRVGP